MVGMAAKGMEEGKLRRLLQYQKLPMTLLKNVEDYYSNKVI